MFRFTIKSLIYITAVVAACALMLSSTINGQTWRAIAGQAVLASLIIWHIYRAECDQLANDERQDQAKEGDETNPTY